MLLPIGDTPNPRNYQAWVTWSLIALNVAVFVLVALPLAGSGVDPRDPLVQEYLRALAPELRSQAELVQVMRSMTQYDLVVFEHGYRPGSPELADLFSSMFLHGGLAHLGGNMLFLWIFGDNVEHRMGRLPFFIAYLGTGAVATLSFALLAGDSQVPLVGASGAISGVLGLYFVAFPRNKVKVFFFLFPFFFNTVLIPCRWVLGFYVVVDNILPLVLGAQSGVAYGAHLGGFVGGLAVAGVGRALAWRLPWSGRGRVGGGGAAALAGSLESGGDEPIDGLREAVRDGDREVAINLLRHVHLGELRRLDPDDVVQVAEWLVEEGHLGAGERVLRQVLGERELTRAQIARALLMLGLLRLAEGRLSSSYQYLSRVVELDADRRATRRALRALEEIPISRGWRG